MSNNYGVDIADAGTEEERTISNFELLKLVAPFFAKYKKRLFFSVTLLPLGAFSSSVQPLIIQKAIDGPLKMLQLSGLMPFVLMLILAVLVHFVIQLVQVYITNNIGQRVIADIRYKLFAHLEKLPMSFFDRTPIGKSVTRITNDMENLGESFTAGIIGGFADLIQIIAIAGFMIYLNFKLAIAVLVLLVPMILLAQYFQKVYREANLKARKELSQLNSFLQQNVVGISVVQLLNSTTKNMRIFDENNKRFVKANDQTIYADSSFSAGIEFISILAMVILLFLSKVLILESALSIGVIIAFLQYGQTLFEPIRNLSDKFTTIQAGLTSAERISHLLDEPISIADPSCKTVSTVNHSSAKEIEFRDIWFKYKDKLILKGLNFSIKPGEKVAIVGKTGAGKSTIIKLLTRLYEAQKGEILIDGVNIKDLKQNDLRELIAVIHQDSYIFAGDVESNIKLKRNPSKVNLDFAKPFLAASTLKLEHELSERASNISAGEEQVISFARAVATNPQVLVLDEATANIDLKTEKIIQDSLEDFMQGRTSIIIAHRLETIKKMDRIIVLEDGVVSESGTHDELINHQGTYHGLYQSRI